VEPILRTLKAAADPNRLRILRILGSGAFNVAELTAILGVGQSTASRHLKLLADAGLVEARRSGTWAYYSLRPDGTPSGSRASDVFPGRLLALVGDSWEDSERDAAAIQGVLRQRRRSTSEFFREAAAGWDRRRDRALGPPRHLDRLLELVGEAGTVVDLGTGTGVLLERLAPAAQHVIGVDASPEMLELARRRIDEARLGDADLRLGRLEHLPVSDGEADAMVANLVLHHVADPPEVLREIRRGLRPGGRLVIADLSEHDDERFWSSLGARWPGFRPEDVQEWLWAAGFRSVEVDPFEAARSQENAKERNGRPEVFLVAATNPHPTRRNG